MNSKSSLNRNTSLAVRDSKGLAALGFFIEVRKHSFFQSKLHVSLVAFPHAVFCFLSKELNNTTGQPASWKDLTNYLSNISLAGKTSCEIDSLEASVRVFS